MLKWRILICFLLGFSFTKASERVPLWETLFYNIGTHSLETFSYAYGVPWLLGASGTYAFIESGADWEWNRFCVRHENISLWASMPGWIVGTLAPFAVPLSLYFGSKDPEIQITGLAMGQAAFLAFGTTTFIKAFTGRVPPHVFDAADGDPDYQEDYSKDFRFGFLRGSIIDGWPSGHTATAVAMSTTLATLYPNNPWIKFGAVLYSATIGISMSFVGHWASDVFAGAIAGYVIGRNVGKSFASLKNGTKQDKLSFVITPSFAGMTLTF